MTIAYLFPGQGSHRIGMGKQLFSTYLNLTKQADSVLGYSIAELCLEGPAERLNDTRHTQCAMYVVGALSYIDAVRSRGVIPNVLAGHSLGEYVALFAAGAYDFRTGLEVVAERARLMAGMGVGAMTAIIGIDRTQVRSILDEHGMTGIDIANINAPDQTVISGPVSDVESVTPVFAERATTVLPLRVSGAFHSRYMASAAEQFGRFLRRFVFARLKIPVIANVSAGPYPDDVAGALCAQLTSPVRWSDTVEYLLDLPDSELYEIGPGTVLSGLTKRIQAGRKPAVAGHA